MATTFKRLTGTYIESAEYASQRPTLIAQTMAVYNRSAGFNLHPNPLCRCSHCGKPLEQGTFDYTYCSWRCAYSDKYREGYGYTP